MRATDKPSMKRTEPSTSSGLRRPRGGGGGLENSKKKGGADSVFVRMQIPSSRTGGDMMQALVLWAIWNQKKKCMGSERTRAEFAPFRSASVGGADRELPHGNLIERGTKSFFGVRSGAAGGLRGGAG